MTVLIDSWKVDVLSSFHVNEEEILYCMAFTQCEGCDGLLFKPDGKDKKSAHPVYVKNILCCAFLFFSYDAIKTVPGF